MYAHNLPSPIIRRGRLILLFIGGGVGYLSVFLTGVGKLKGNAATTILPSSVSSTATNSPSGTVYIAAGGTSPLPTSKSEPISNIQKPPSHKSRRKVASPTAEVAAYQEVQPPESSSEFSL